MSASRPAAAGPQQPGTLPSDDDQRAERTRQLLEQLSLRYPPAVGRAFKRYFLLSSICCSTWCCTAECPLYSTRNPVTRNPGYFLENIENPNTFYNDPLADASGRRCWQFSRVSVSLSRFSSSSVC